MSYIHKMNDDKIINFSLENLNEAIKNKKNIASGLGQINYMMINQLTDVYKDFLIKFINNSFNKLDFPKILTEVLAHFRRIYRATHSTQ